MSNNVTEIVFILDKSGSMARFTEDTVGGFNATVERQRQMEGEVLVSTVLFNDESEVLHDRVPIEKIAPLTRDDYCVSGCTALLDAIGGAIHHIGNVHKYARPEDVPARTVFMITTDGMENASHHYSSGRVKQMIERQQKKYGWEFVFLAANIDAVETASRIGIRRERAANYRHDPEGVRESYAMMCDAITALRAGEDLDSGSWRRPNDENKGGKKK